MLEYIFREFTVKGCMGNLLPGCTSIGMLIDLFKRNFKTLESYLYFPEVFFSFLCVCIILVPSFRALLLSEKGQEQGAEIR